MPSMICHLSFAQEIYRNLEKGINAVEFFSGNLIPDLVFDKKASHYKIHSIYSGFDVPDMDLVKRNLYDINNPIKFGLYCHLYLDYHFIEDFLFHEFIFDKDNKEIINPRNGIKWNMTDFFAPAFNGGILYKGYSQINNLMLKDGHIDQEFLDTLPDILPSTGIPIFDSRYEMTWREEFDAYFSTAETYTDEIFDYNRLCTALSHISQNFIDEEL